MDYEIIYQYYDIVILANDEKIAGVNLITMKTHKIHHALFGFDLEDFEKSQCYEDIKNMEE